MNDEELQAAEAHIARLEEELLRLKDCKRELESVRKDHQSFRRSAGGRLASLLNGAVGLLVRRGTAPAKTSAYEKWFAAHRTPDTKSMREAARRLSYAPLVSILLPTWNSKPSYLNATIESVMAQLYETWELVVADDGSDDPALRASLEQWAQRDKRIHLHWAGERRGISAALNLALKHARGDWIALLDHDDLLESDALFRVLELLQTDREADVIYSDEDKIVDGRLAAPMFKPDWSPEFFLTHDYLGHLVVLRRELASAGFRTECDGAQDYDLLLRVAERTQRIRHIPRVLYHWRRTAESTAHNIRRKPGALEAGRRSLQEHLARTGVEGRVSIDWSTHAYRVRRDFGSVTISVLPIGGDVARADQIRRKTARGTLEWRESWDGEWLLFLDEELEPLQPGWLTSMAEQLANPRVGAVGTQILKANDTIESAGYILRGDGSVVPAFAGFPRDAPGVNRQLQMIRNYSAVSASCLLTRRDLFRQVSSVDLESFRERVRRERVCAGVEYCLGLRQAGFRIVSVPYAQLRHRSGEHVGTVSCPEVARRWPEWFERDPYYNPNLGSEQADFSVGKNSSGEKE